MGLALDEPKDDDQVFDEQGLTYLINKGLLEQVKPVKVDYVNSAWGSGFSISSGMQPAAGCGSSCSC